MWHLEAFQWYLQDFVELLSLKKQLPSNTGKFWKAHLTKADVACAPCLVHALKWGQTDSLAVSEANIRFPPVLIYCQMQWYIHIELQTLRDWCIIN